MDIQPALLTATADALRSGKLDLLTYVAQVCEWVERLDAELQAFMPEADRSARLHDEALALQARFPSPAQRPPLYGVLVGIKDIFRVDGLPTTAGSRLPPEVLAGTEAAAVTTLKTLGALILGKTVTAEFAYIEPGPTRNPHNLAHTPGGSSSGSAAAVAAGFCPLALGTQTIGSVIRPASFCGIVGFKPSYGRISTEGVIPVSTALDHVGLFAQDIAGAALAASLLCRDWRPLPISHAVESLPVLGIPVGAYLEQASPEALAAFAVDVDHLEQAGYMIKRVPCLDDIDAINAAAARIMFGEMAAIHADWFARFEPLYRARTAAVIRGGLITTESEKQVVRLLQQQTRADLEALMEAESIDVWITPAATGPAPLGLGSTGNFAMNLPWSFSGQPAITVPASVSADGLPLGLQCAATFMADERLFHWCAGLGETLRSARMP